MYFLFLIVLIFSQFSWARNEFVEMEFFQKQFEKYEAGERINFAEGGFSELHFVAAAGDIKNVERVIRNKADVDKASNEGVTPLMAACYNGASLRVIETLLDESADAGRLSSSKNSVLHFAAHVEIVEEAVDKLFELFPNAKIDGMNLAGNTPLHIATDSGSLSMIRALAQRGAEIDKTNKKGRTPLHLAAMRGEDAMIFEVFRELSADFNAQDIYGNTPLHYAARNKLSTVNALLERGADLSIKRKNNKDKSPGQLAHSEEIRLAMVCKVLDLTGTGFLHTLGRNALYYVATAPIFMGMCLSPLLLIPKWVLRRCRSRNSRTRIDSASSSPIRIP